jgi:NADH-quinone oxidoreductase subunit L
MNGTAQNLWLIPALPLLAAGINALLRQRHRKLAASLAIGSMGLAFVLSCFAFSTTLGAHDGAFQDPHSFRWLQFGGAELKLGWVLDPLSACMLLMVSLVGLLIFIYSLGYMAHDENFTRFFCFLSLFAAAMLGLVIANSLLLLFICWELVGLASYLLIGFWYQKPSAAAAAKKAFITTRVGDVLFFLGMVWLYAETGTLLFYDGGAGCLEQGALAKLVGQATVGGMAVSTVISLLIFCGAIGKSGQVPLHVWLPDAMEGPTPVSALIHAATMVAAGVFLVARVYPLMAAVPTQAAIVVQAQNPLTPTLSPGEREKVSQPGLEIVAPVLQPVANPIHPLPKGEGRSKGEKASDHAVRATASRALKTVTWVGAITAVFAALIAVAQTDIKRILAYSTVSQLGYMMMGIGVGGVPVGMFHLITHAFFKAVLFLGAGSVIHGCHEEQDIRRMGGLRQLMPVTFTTYAVGMMALAGFPLFFSGFWSKDEILHSALVWAPSRWPFYLGILGAFLTAFYMTRQVAYVFFGESRTGVPPVPGKQRADSHSESRVHPAGQAGSLSYVHESPRVMTVPLVVLGACAVLLSIIGTPAWPWFHDYLSGHHGETAGFTRATLGVMALSTLIVAAGVWLGWRLYVRRSIRSAEEPDVLEELEPDLFTLLRRKFFVDEFYETTIVRWNGFLAWISGGFDRWVLDNAVKAVTACAVGLAWLDRLFDEFVVNLGFDRGCGSLRQSGRLLSLWHNGQVQRYLRVIGLAVAVLALVFIWGCK